MIPKVKGAAVQFIDDLQRGIIRSPEHDVHFFKLLFNSIRVFKEDEYCVMWAYLYDTIRSTSEVVKIFKNIIMTLYGDKRLYASAESESGTPPGRRDFHINENDFLYDMYKCLTKIRNGMSILMEKPMKDYLDYGDGHFYIFM